MTIEHIAALEEILFLHIRTMDDFAELLARHEVPNLQQIPDDQFEGVLQEIKQFRRERPT